MLQDRRNPCTSAVLKLVACAGLGPIMDGIGLFHAVMSCNGKLSIAVNACREMLPDPKYYAQCMSAAYDGLRSATLGDTGK